MPRYSIYRYGGGWRFKKDVNNGDVGTTIWLGTTLPDLARTVWKFRHARR